MYPFFPGGIMKKVLIFIVGILLSCGAYAQSVWYTGSVDDAMKLADKESKYVLLNLTSGSS
jgi:hypothetical protein